MIDAKLMTPFVHGHNGLPTADGLDRLATSTMTHGSHHLADDHCQEFDKLFLLNRLAASHPMKSTEVVCTDQLVITAPQDQQYVNIDGYLDCARQLQTGAAFFPLDASTMATIPNAMPVSNSFLLRNRNLPGALDYYYYETEEETCESESENEMMDEEFDNDEGGSYIHYASEKPDDPSGLLNFIQDVTRDVQNLFARNKGMEDYCDVYEERFKTTLTGQELYYAELLALASNDDMASTRRNHKRSRSSADRSSSSRAVDSLVQSPASNGSGSPFEMRNPSEHTVVYGLDGQPKTCSLPHEGRCILAYGLGPLEDLFQACDMWKNHHGLTSESYSPSNALSHYGVSATTAGNLPLQNSLNTSFGMSKPNLFPSRALPMSMRKLPTSFWEEPSPENRSELLSVTRTPDFADLFDQWTSDKC